MREAAGAPDVPFAVPVAPRAPDPFVPEVFAPVKLMTVIIEAVLCDSVAVTETLVSGDDANARQISEVPS